MVMASERRQTPFAGNITRMVLDPP